MTSLLKLIHVLSNGLREAPSRPTTTHNWWHQTEQISTNTPSSTAAMATSCCVDGSAQQVLEGLERSKNWVVSVGNIYFPQTQPETPQKWFQVNRKKNWAYGVKLKQPFYLILVNNTAATSFTLQVSHLKKPEINVIQIKGTALGHPLRGRRPINRQQMKQDKMVSLSESLWPGYRC